MTVDFRAKKKIALNVVNGQVRLVSQLCFVIIVHLVPKEMIVPDVENIWEAREFLLTFAMIAGLVKEVENALNAADNCFS